jgi:MFS family permease
MKKGLLAGISANILLLGVVSFITDVSSDMIWPILPLFIKGSLAGPAVAGLAVGLIGGLGKSVASILKVFAGYWSDRLGRRKPLVASGYATSSAAKLFFPAATHWLHMLFLRPLERVGKGLRTAPRDAIIADSTCRGVRGKGFGIHRALDTSGAIVGSILAFVLFLSLGLGFRSIFLIAAGIGFLALLPLVWVREIKRKPKKTTLKISLRELQRPLRLFILIATIFALGNFTYMFFILKASDVLGFGTTEIALTILLYVLFNISYAGLSIPCGALSDKLGRRRVLGLGYSVFGLTCLGFIFSNSLAPLVVLFLLYGVFYALVEGVQRAYASDLASRGLRGTALGTFHTSIGLAALPAGVVAGILWTVDPDLTFIYGAIVAFLASGLLLVFMRRYGA